MAKTSLKLLFLGFLLISQIDIRLAQDDGEEGEAEATTAGEVATEKAAEAKSEGDKGGGGEFSPADLQKKYDTIKNDKSGNGLKGKGGKVMQIVVEAIKEINPVRLIEGFDPDPILSVNGIDVEKLKVPVNYLADTFFDKFAAKTKKSKKELSKELGVDVEAKKEGDWISLGTMLKVGKKSDLKLGDYLNFLGLDMAPYEKKYDDSLIEAVRVPVQFIDEISTEGLHKYLDKFKAYINTNGGAVNSALKAYGDYTGKDIVSETQKAIKKLKTYNVTAANEAKAKYEKQVQEYKEMVNKQIKQFYNEWFGKGGRAYVYQARVITSMNDLIKFLASFYSGDRLNAGLNLVGNAIGPEGRAIAYIVYQPTAVLFNQIFGPLLLIPRIMTDDGEIWEKVLALPPVIIQTSGGLFKPGLMVVEPFIRLGRFMMTGEYTKSLSAGLDVAAAYGISIWGGAYKPKQKSSQTTETTPPKQTAPKKRSKRQTPAKAAAKGADKKDKKEKEKEKVPTPEEAARYTRNDKKLAETYQGGPPPGGYKLGVKNDGNIDLDDEDMISRLLLSPDFILKAGGPVFVPFASVLAPALRAVNTVLFGKADFNQRMAEVPDIIRGVGLIGPFADIVQTLLPFVKTGYMAYSGNLTYNQAIVQMPSLLKQLTNGVLYNVYKNPQKLIKSMFVFFEGHGGLIAMLKLQANGDVPLPDPGAAEDAKQYLGPEANLILRFLGDFFGGWALGYIQALGPVGSLEATFFNGVLGNLLDPVKFMDTNPNLKMQPIKNLLEAFDDLPRLLKSCADKRSFLTAVLGGQDPDVLNEIGISAEKLAENNIDPGLFLAGGKRMIDEEHRKKLNDESGLESIGIKGSMLSKINIDTKTLLESGLLDAKEDKLEEIGIDINLILNRVMRGSVEDQTRLQNAGLEIRSTLKAGICPALLLASGVHAIPDDKLKAAGIKNPNELSDENLKALGLNPTKLHSKGINAKKLAQEGVESYAHIQGNMGINVNTLLSSVYTGMDPKIMLKAGIDVKAMARAGIDTKLLLVGGLRKALKGDITPKSLQKVGINGKQIIAMGININLVLDIGVGVLNPMNLVKMGIEPMSVLIWTLSRHGLDVMTGGVGDPVAVSFGFINSILRIVNNMVRLVPKIRELPGGKTIIGPDGRFVGPAAILFYNIIGIDNTGGLLGLIQKIYSGKFTTAEILKMVNPIRITNAVAHPEVKPAAVKKRVKDNRKSVDEYVNKSQNLRVGQSRGKDSKGSALGSKDDTYDESKLLPTESADGGAETTAGGEESSGKSRWTG